LEEIMALDSTLLRTSFDIVIRAEPNFTHRFYETLFTSYPELRPLFGRNAQKQQADMLSRALVAVVDHLDDAPWLNEHLRSLGAKHVAYGVRPEMYDWVGNALLRTLANAAGDAWTEEVARQWTAAYGVIVDLMRQGEALVRPATSMGREPRANALL
jgi:hemoglobin-like flavoprotein